MSLEREAREHLAALESLGVAAAARERLALYLGALATWSERINLTGARTPAERVTILVAPIVPVAERVAPGHLLDIGAGNGSPGLVLGLLRPELQVTLLEPRTKRWAFLREAARVAGRPDVDVVRARHEAYAGPPVQTLTVRALRVRLPDLQRLVAAGGRVIVFGAEPAAAAGFERDRAGAWPAGLHVFRRGPAA